MTILSPELLYFLFSTWKNSCLFLHYWETRGFLFKYYCRPRQDIFDHFTSLKFNIFYEKTGTFHRQKLSFFILFIWLYIPCGIMPTKLYFCGESLRHVPIYLQSYKFVFVFVFSTICFQVVQPWTCFLHSLTHKFSRFFIAWLFHFSFVLPLPLFLHGFHFVILLISDSVLLFIYPTILMFVLLWFNDVFYFHYFFCFSHRFWFV